MRALTIKQPWAWAIAMGYKAVENRSWAPSAKVLAVGDRFAIHAGALDPSGADFVLARLGIVDKKERAALIAVWRAQRGSILATVNYRGTVDSAMQLPSSARPWFFGPIAWVLGDVVRGSLTGIDNNLRGHLGLWNLANAKPRSTP